ncbi:hypothetical protein BH09BAC3_BH09BAC3_05870 [soil metagenome]
MGEELSKAVGVFLLSMLKFILGPITGFGAKLHFVTTVVATISGMMVSVVAFTYFGEWIKSKVVDKIFKKKKKPAKERSAFWSKYGLTGVALFTPVFLTPIGGTILALSLGYPKEKILFYMLISAVSWSVIFSGIIYFVGAEVLPEFIH